VGFALGIVVGYRDGFDGVMLGPVEGATFGVFETT